MNPLQRPFVRRALVAVVLVAGLHTATATAASDRPHGVLPASEPSATVIAAPVSWSALQEAISARAAWYQWAAALPPPAPPDPPAVRPRPARHTGSSHHGYATAKDCVAGDENGSDYGRSSNPSHFGRYQFSRDAWVSYGGDPDTWGSASPDEQDRVFENAWSQGPAVQEGQWLRWDGC